MSAHLIVKSELTLYFTAIDIFTLTLLVLVGFRSSMVVTFAQLKNPQMIINIFRGVIVVVVLLVWAFVIPFLKHKMGVSIHYWYLVATVVALSIYLYFSNIIAMYRLYNIINAVTLLEPMLLLFWFSLAFFAFDLRGIQPLFIGTIMSSFGVSMFIYMMSKKYYQSVVIKRPVFDEKAIKFLKNSVISTIEFGSGIVLLYMVVFLMLKYFTIDELGDFQVVTKPIFTYMMMLFVFPIFRFVLPELSKLVSDKNIAEISELKRWIYRYAFIVSGVFLVGALLFSTDIIELLFPPQYIGASLMLKHLAFFFIFLIINAYQIAFIKASGAFLSALLIRLFGIFVLIITFYSIYIFFSTSVISLIIALVASYVGMFIVSFVLERKIFRKLQQNN
jgi:O-antigen/teichoic acid export membrane protein